jgi:hypothetical protein
VFSDFHLFRFFKKYLAGKRFAKDAEVKQAVISWLGLRTLEKDFFYAGMKALVPSLSVSVYYVEI